MVELTPLYFMSDSSGTSCGMVELTAGVCTPAPRERMTDITKSAVNRGTPSPMYGINRASASVAAAITASAKMISHFRGNLSAHTPEKNEIMNCGT
ncbi:hypothetical protein SDC9_187933 [bioreactor metagenome]|uniref:Uncharacterized protein n=1 Tax=bioreactor metagenome TaxID=1076179 RepID=A0A645HP89_9ZZZZ